MSDLSFEDLTDHSGKAVKEWFTDSSGPIITEIVTKFILLRMHWNVNKSNPKIVESCRTVASALQSLGRDQESARMILEIIRGALDLVAGISRQQCAIETAAQLSMVTPNRHASHEASCTPTSAGQPHDTIARRLELSPELSPVHHASSESAEAAAVKTKFPGERAKRRASWLETRQLFIDFSVNKIVTDMRLGITRAGIAELVKSYCDANPHAEENAVKRFFIGGQPRADFFKSLQESAKSAFGRLFADFFL